MGTLHFFKALCAFALVLFISCSDDNTVEGEFEQLSGEKVSLTIEIIPEGSGVVLPKSGEYTKGHQMTLRALPNDGYLFSYWEGESTVTGQTHIITMDSDKRVVAVFRESINDFRNPME